MAPPFRLQALLDARCDAEEAAIRAVGDAVAARTRAEEAQRELEARVGQTRWRLDEDRALRADAVPSDAAAGQTRELFRRRLESEWTRAKEATRAHREGALAAALAAEAEARREHLARRRDREALEQLKERETTEARKVAERRAEDEAGDLALAAHHKKNTSGS